MARKGFKPRQIIHMRREAEVKLAGGRTVGEVCRFLSISEQSYYRWRKEYGGMQVSQAKRLKALDRRMLASRSWSPTRPWAGHPEGGSQVKLLSPERRRKAVNHIASIAFRTRLQRVGVKTLFIEPGSPWENVHNESFNSKLRDELLNGEIFYTLREAQIIVERWRRHYNEARPHSSLGYKPPAPQTRQPKTNWVAPKTATEAQSVALSL